jgi:hypothetical protein
MPSAVILAFVYLLVTSPAQADLWQNVRDHDPMLRP